MVLDIFFEALNYETIEQKKAYELPGLLGNVLSYSDNFFGLPNEAVFKGSDGVF